MVSKWSPLGARGAIVTRPREAEPKAGAARLPRASRALFVADYFRRRSLSHASTPSSAPTVCIHRTVHSIIRPESPLARGASCAVISYHRVTFVVRPHFIQQPGPCSETCKRSPLPSIHAGIKKAQRRDRIACDTTRFSSYMGKKRRGMRRESTCILATFPASATMNFLVSNHSFVALASYCKFQHTRVPCYHLCVASRPVAPAGVAVRRIIYRARISLQPTQTQLPRTRNQRPHQRPACTLPPALAGLLPRPLSTGTTSPLPRGPTLPCWPGNRSRKTESEQSSSRASWRRGELPRPLCHRGNHRGDTAGDHLARAQHHHE